MSGAAALTGLVVAITALFLIYVAERRRVVKTVEKQLRLSFPADYQPRFATVFKARTSRKRQRPESRKYAELCAEVASRLHAGVPTAQAWERSWGRVMETSSSDSAVYPGNVDVDEDGVPSQIAASSDTVPRAIAAATRISGLTGAPLAETLQQCAASIEDMEQADSARRIAYAGPRMSARVLSALPLVGLLGAEFLGAQPVRWFFSGVPQMLLAAVGIGLAVSGNLVSRRMIRRASESGQEQQWSPVLCDLAVSALRVGVSVPGVLQSIGAAVKEEEFTHIGAELTLGATWGEAWSTVPYGGELLRRGMRSAWEEGVSPMTMLRQLSQQTRRSNVSKAKESAEKLGVKLALPLGLLILPSFVVLGLVPTFFALMGSEVLAPFGIG